MSRLQQGRARCVYLRGKNQTSVSSASPWAIKNFKEINALCIAPVGRRKCDREAKGNWENRQLGMDCIVVEWSGVPEVTRFPWIHQCQASSMPSQPNLWLRWRLYLAQNLGKRHSDGDFGGVQGGGEQVVTTGSSSTREMEAKIPPLQGSLLLLNPPHLISPD